MPRALVILLGAAGAVITVAGLKTVAWLITPIFLALIIVITVSPIHRRLRKSGIPGWAATTALVLLVYGTLLAFAIVVFVSVARLTAILPGYVERFDGIAQDLAAVLRQLGIALLGIPLAVLWGLLSFVTNYIPNIGFLMGLIPPAILALLGSGWQLLLVVVLIYWAVNFVVQSVIQPNYVGDSVGLSPVTTFVALVFWAWVLGPLGALLAVPATLLVMAVLVDIDPRAGWATALTRHTKKQRS